MTTKKTKLKTVPKKTVKTKKALAKKVKAANVAEAIEVTAVLKDDPHNFFLDRGYAPEDNRTVFEAHKEQIEDEQLPEQTFFQKHALKVIALALLVGWAIFGIYAPKHVTEQFPAPIVTKHHG